MTARLRPAVPYRCRRQHEFLGPDLAHQPVPDRRGGADGEVGLPGFHRGGQVAGVPELHQPYLHVGYCRAIPQRRRKHADSQGAGHAAISP